MDLELSHPAEYKAGQLDWQFWNMAKLQPAGLEHWMPDYLDSLNPKLQLHVINRSWP
jgi:hypothetical protein